MAQLCAQIRRVLDMTLVGDCEDEVLQNMCVHSVDPAAGNRVQVVFTVFEPGASLQKADVLARLEAARPLFVEEIARSVERRSIPELTFWVIKEGEESPVPEPAPDDDTPPPDPADA